MGNRIHWRIFIPVIFIIMFLAAATWLIFSFTAGHYAAYVSQQDLTKLMNMIGTEVGDIYGEEPLIEEQEREKQRQVSKDLLAKVKDNLNSDEQNARLTVLNSQYKRIYPRLDPEEVVNQILFEKCVQVLQTDYQAGGASQYKITIGSDAWLISILEVPSSVNVRAKYYIGYVRIPDMGLLLNYSGKLLSMIALVGFLGAVIAVWGIARSIARPLGDMCRQADRIGEGSFIPIETKYSLYELERLKRSLNQMEERLKESDERNVRFFQNISHDLRTPLVAITGYAQGIQHGIMEDPRKAAGIILAESLRMTNLVESILTISKMDSNDLPLNMISMDMEEFLEEQIELLKGISDEKELLFRAVDDAVYVQSDPDLTARIIQNVVANCIRHAEKTVTVELMAGEQWGVVRITDDGAGFSQKDISRVFERFYYGADGVFGIGLSIVLAGMEYMGGSVTVSNRELPDHGAVYELLFPTMSQWMANL